MEALNGAGERSRRETDLALLFLAPTIHYPLFPKLTARGQKTPSLTLIR